MATSTRRRPTWSARVPISGEASVPTNCSAPNNVSISTEPVSTSTYQPRMIVSISSAQAAHKSAGHWKRKLRVPNGAIMGKRPRAVSFIARPSAMVARWNLPNLFS